MAGVRRLALCAAAVEVSGCDQAFLHDLPERRAANVAAGTLRVTDRYDGASD
jgi:hypothetical protein